MNDLEIYEKLKANLPAGAMVEVANDFKVSKAMVTKVAKGIIINQQILIALIEKAEKFKKEREKIKIRIKDL